MMDDDGRWTDDGPWLYYKLTNEPKGSGEEAIFDHEGKHDRYILTPVCLDRDNFIAYDAMLRKQSFDKAYDSKYLHSIRGSITTTSLSQP